MCLIAFAIGASQRWPLVIASNRDEFLNRPTLPLHRWQTACGQEIISGRDLRAGGTWLGMTPTGRVAFLTNVREGAPKGADFSRGELVTRWLESRTDACSFATSLEKEKHHFGGFNLVLGDVQRNDWMWMTNRSVASASNWHSQTLPPGVYGLSNAALDTPWPKTVALKKVLSAALFQENLLQSPLWAALGNRARVPFLNLPTTGVSSAMEAALSSVFVDFPEHGYGTCSSTVLVAGRTLEPTANRSLQIEITEQTHLHAFTETLPTTSSIAFNLSL